MFIKIIKCGLYAKESVIFVRENMPSHLKNTFLFYEETARIRKWQGFDITTHVVFLCEENVFLQKEGNDVLFEPDNFVLREENIGLLL